MALPTEPPVSAAPLQREDDALAWLTTVHLGYESLTEPGQLF
jgi:hypothetical protein